MRSKLFQVFLFFLIRAYSKTFQFKIENDDEWLALVKKGQCVLLCGWHQQFFSAIAYFKKYSNYSPGIMISRSVDGEVIAGVAKLTGWKPVRGSSSKGGKSALIKMIEYLKRSKLAGHIMDGPRGPMGIIKAGAIRIALEANAVIVPFYVEADRAWYFRSWDRFFIPKPFAKVVLRYDKMIKLASISDEETFESQRKLVENIMLKGLILKK